jgi:hypothetical protein
MDTLRARGADKENSVFRPTDVFLNIAVILHLLFNVACLSQLNHPPLPHGWFSAKMVYITLTSISLSWKGKIKYCSFVDFSFRPHLPTMSVNDALYNGKPNAGSLELV